MKTKNTKQKKNWKKWQIKQISLDNNLYNLEYINSGSSFIVYKAIPNYSGNETKIIKHYFEDSYRNKNIQNNDDIPVPVIKDDDELKRYNNKKILVSDKITKLGLKREELPFKNKIIPNTIIWKSKQLFVFQPYFEGTTLKDFKPNDSSQVLKTCKSLIEILRAFHENGLILLDMSLDNFFITKELVVLLIDIDGIIEKKDLSNFNSKNTNLLLGKYTRRYTKPEFIKAIENSNSKPKDLKRFGEDLDIYSSGAIMLDIMRVLPRSSSEIENSQRDLLKNFFEDCINGKIKISIEQDHKLNEIEKVFEKNRLTNVSPYISLMDELVKPIESKHYNPIIDEIFTKYKYLDLNKKEFTLIQRIEGLFSRLQNAVSNATDRQKIINDGLIQVDKLNINRNKSDFIKYYCLYRKQSFLFDTPTNSSNKDLINNFYLSASAMKNLYNTWFTSKGIAHKDPYDKAKECFLRAWILNTYAMCFYKVEVLCGVKVKPKEKEFSKNAIEDAVCYSDLIPNKYKNIFSSRIQNYKRNYGVIQEWVYKKFDFVLDEDLINTSNNVLKAYINDIDMPERNSDPVKINSFICLLSFINKRINNVLATSCKTYIHVNSDTSTDEAKELWNQYSKNKQIIDRYLRLYFKYLLKMEQRYEDTDSFWQYYLIYLKDKMMIKKHVSQNDIDKIKSALNIYVSKKEAKTWVCELVCKHVGLEDVYSNNISNLKKFSKLCELK